MAYKETGIRRKIDSALAFIYIYIQIVLTMKGTKSSSNSEVLQCILHEAGGSKTVGVKVAFGIALSANLGALPF